MKPINIEYNEAAFALGYLEAAISRHADRIGNVLKRYSGRKNIPREELSMLLGEITSLPDILNRSLEERREATRRALNGNRS
jgi:hypothetical protein